MTGWLAVLAAAVAGPAIAGDSPLLGEWCADGPEGDSVYYIEAGSLGVHEHTMCDWRDPPTGANLKTVIDCRNIYLNGDQVVETNHQSLAFAAEMRADGTLSIQVAEEPAVEFHRCAY